MYNLACGFSADQIHVFYPSILARDLFFVFVGVCPVLCSQKGEYINGECQCNPGWKGKECSLRHDECEVPDCNGHGHCVNGKCACIRGFKGKFCAEVDCPHPTCSGHGFCIEGSCFCKKGWKGADCATMDKDALQCLPDCTGHGTFDLDTQTCTCEARWSGEDCSRGNLNTLFLFITDTLAWIIILYKLTMIENSL